MLIDFFSPGYELDQLVSYQVLEMNKLLTTVFTYHHSFLLSLLLPSFQIDSWLRWIQLLLETSTSSSQPNEGSVKCVLYFAHDCVPSS